MPGDCFQWRSIDNFLFLFLDWYAKPTWLIHICGVTDSLGRAGVTVDHKEWIMKYEHHGTDIEGRFPSSILVAVIIQ